MCTVAPKFANSNLNMAIIFNEQEMFRKAHDQLNVSTVILQ